MVSGVPAGAPPLRLRGRELSGPVVMAVVNRTPDSFYAAARYDEDGAREAVARAADEGAAIVDLGGVRAGRGPEVSAADEIARVVPLVAHARRAHPDLLVSVDTWRGQVAAAAADEGADLVNDTWAGHDPRLVEVAAERGLGVVVSHTGGASPRTDPFRVRYGDSLDGVVDDVVAALSAPAPAVEQAKAEFADETYPFRDTGQRGRDCRLPGAWHDQDGLVAPLPQDGGELPLLRQGQPAAWQVPDDPGADARHVIDERCTERGGQEIHWPIRPALLQHPHDGMTADEIPDPHIGNDQDRAGLVCFHLD